MTQQYQWRLGERHYVEPVVIVPRSLLVRMVNVSARYKTESGEMLVGIVREPAFPWSPATITLLGAIPADESTERYPALVVMGGQTQKKYFDWLYRNWEHMREASRSNQLYATHKPEEPVPPHFIPRWADYPIMYSGVWHRHPGQAWQPSGQGGDWTTMHDILVDPNYPVDYVIAPIVTRDDPSDQGVVTLNNKVLGLQGAASKVQVYFWYLDEWMAKKGAPFAHINPTIVEDNQLPQLPAIAWHLVNPARYESEMQLLAQYGCDVRMDLREMNGAPPVEVIFAIRREGWDPEATVLVVTDVNYPATRPSIRVVRPTPDNGIEAQPPHDHNAFKRWWEEMWERFKGRMPGKEAPAEQPPAPAWTASSTLLQEVMWLEQQGGLVWQPQTQAPQA